MRIGMILDAEYPNDARISNECESLIKAGHEIFLFCLSYNKSFIRQEIINQINVRRYFCSKISYKLSALANDISFYSNVMFNKIYDFALTNEVEALHIHDIQIAGASLKVAKKLQIKTVLDLHENRPEIMKYYKHVNSFFGKLLISTKRWKKAEEKFVNQSDKVIVVTKEAKKELLKRCNKKNNEIIIYPNTVRPGFYKNKIIDTKIKQTYFNDFVMLYIGNTSKRRGLDTVLDSMNTIKKSVNNIKLIILGKSSYDYKLKKKINKLKLDLVVDFKGWIDESELYKYLLISDIGISPLHSNLHHDTTYANKLFQYMSFRVPIVCSDSKAQANLIKENNCGVVFKNNDANDFTRVLLDLIKNKSKLKTLSKNCQIAIDKLNNNFVSKDLTNIYA